MSQSRTVVCFHAHPDDEVLLTGGTMARLAAEGHRVVLVTATAGDAGLAGAQLTGAESLGARRGRELARSAQLLGCARLVVLGYPDSGMTGESPAGDRAFSRVPVQVAAERLSEVLDEEAAAALTVHDSVGGYGHPDHVHVHRVGHRAAELVGTPVVLDATVDRQALQRALRVASWSRPRSPDFRPARFAERYTDHSRITHRVDVRAFLAAKRAAMRAHASQATGGDGERTLAWLLRLPEPLFRIACGHEWFVERDRAPARPPMDDVLASLRERP